MSDLELEVEEDVGEIEEDVDEVGGPVALDVKKRYTGKDLEELADKLLREDSNRELCRVCKEAAKKAGDDESLPYGTETGEVEWKLQLDKKGNPILDEEDHPLYVKFPQLQCEAGHKWYLGEGVRRALDGPNPILFEAHLYNRKRRELLATDGVVDPAYTMDRWGKRPTQGLYYRSHPLGRKTNSPEQRKAHGAGFYK
jgi:hypothetical protein